MFQASKSARRAAVPAACFIGSALFGAVAVTIAPAAPAFAQEKMNAVDREFARKASQGNLAEVQVGQLALQKSQNEKVRMIAQMLVTEHGKSQEDLRKHAQMAGVSVPGETDKAHKAMYQKLSRLSGAAFDKEFLRGQVRDHYATVALFKKEQDKGGSSHLRSYAAQYLPGIQGHTQMIVAAAHDMGIPTGAPATAGKSMPAMSMPAGANTGGTNNTGGGTTGGTTTPPPTQPTQPPATPPVNH